MPAPSISPRRELSDALDSRTPPDPVAVSGVSAVAYLLARQHEPEDQCRDRLDHEPVAAPADACELRPHLHRRKLVFRLYQLAEIRHHQHSDFDLGGAAGGLRLLTLPLPWRQASLLLAAVEPHGAGRGLRASVL